MEELMDSNLMFLQAGLTLAVPVCLATLVNLGCGKKRDQPGSRPGGVGANKNLSKTAKSGAAGASSKSGKSKRSTASGKSVASKSKSSKKGKSKDKSSKGSSKSKRSTKSKSIDKSGKSGKSSKKSKSSKGSKKSKRETLAQTGPQSSQRSDKLTGAVGGQQQPPSSTRTAMAIDAEKTKQAAGNAANALTHENSAKSAATQRSVSVKPLPPSRAPIVDANGNATGATSIVAVAGDSTRELKMEPAELRWSSSGGMQKISLLNQSNERQAIKVKCSDNNVYRVNPVYAIVEPGQTLNVDVMRQNGSNKVDKIVFVTTKAGIEENPKNLFKPGTHSTMMVLPLLATSQVEQPTPLIAGV